MAGNIFTSNYGTRINVAGLNNNQLSKIKNLANSKYGTRATNLANQWRTKIPKVTTPPPAATTTPPPAATTQPAINPPTPAAPTAEQQQTTANNLFPTERMFEPKNYEGSPLYQFQVQQGQKQLGKSLAARGLSNSGYGIQEELNIPMMAAAQDTDRMTRVAEGNANRLQTIQENEAMRRERAGNTQWDRQYSLAQLLADQSPWNAAISGLGSVADTTGQAGNSYANYLRQAFQRVMGGGGGGGRGFTPVQVPGGPDYSNINLAGLNGSSNSSNNWMNLLVNGLSKLF